MAQKVAVTVLFGAGIGAEIWLQRWRDASASYLIIDNDSGLWGLERYGVAIVPPDAIQDVDIEKVIVLFSHVRDARAQLLALGVPDCAIEVPPKPAFRPQPFLTAARRREALDALRHVLDALLDASVSPIVEQGAALGLYRDSDLIKWDNDIDIGIAWEQSSNLSVQSVNALLGSLDGRETSVTVTESGLLATWLHGDARIPFTVYSRRVIRGLAVATDAEFHSVTASVWWPPRSYCVDGFKYPLPANPEQYFEQIYGSDWKTPRPEFSFGDYPQSAKDF